MGGRSALRRREMRLFANQGSWRWSLLRVEHGCNRGLLVLGLAAVASQRKRRSRVDPASVIGAGEVARAGSRDQIVHTLPRPRDPRKKTPMEPSSRNKNQIGCNHDYGEFGEAGVNHRNADMKRDDSSQEQWPNDLDPNQDWVKQF